MGLLVPGHEPPKSVPGPFQPPNPPTNRMKSVSMPGWRKMVTPHETNLQEVASRAYRDPGGALRVFNDNRSTQNMPDGSPGALAGPNDVIPAGTTIWLSS